MISSWRVSYFFQKDSMLKDIVLEPRSQLDVKSSSGQIVWDCKCAGCIYLAGDSFNPQIGSRIPNTKQVKYFG